MHHLTYFNFSTIEHHMQSCEQKTDFSSARWDGMLYACSKLFPESDKRIV